MLNLNVICINYVISYLVRGFKLDALINEHFQIFEYSGDLKVLDKVVSASIQPALNKYL